MKIPAKAILFISTLFTAVVSAQKYEQSGPFYYVRIELYSGVYYLEEQHCTGIVLSAGTYITKGDTLFFHL